eukprot:Nk52_evm29s226 gene=Nk52_evmTU29s226
MNRKGIANNSDNFSEQLDVFWKHVSSWNDDQTDIAFRGLLERCSMEQISLLSQLVKPKLRKDPFQYLPEEICIHVLSYLDFFSLLQCGRVSRRWRMCAIENSLWIKLWQRRVLGGFWKLAEMEREMLTHRFHGHSSVKRKYLLRMMMERNWLSGEYSVQTLEGHSDSVACLSLQQQELYTGSDDHTIRHWDLETSHCIRTFSGHTNIVTCLAVDKNHMVSGSWDATLKVWSLKTGECLRTIRGHAAAVLCVQFKGRLVLSGSFDNTIKVFDLKTGQCKRTLRGHTNSVLCLQFDRNKIISGSEDTSIKIWSLNDNICLTTLLGHTGPVTCLQYDEKYIVSGSCDKTIRIWDVHTAECIRSLTGHQGAIHCLQFDEFKIVSGSGNETIKVWDITSGTCIHSLEVHTSYLNCIQFDDRRIVSGSGDREVKVLDFSPSLSSHANTFYSSSPSSTSTFVYNNTFHEHSSSCRDCDLNLLASAQLPAEDGAGPALHRHKKRYTTRRLSDTFSLEIGMSL